MHLHIFLVDLSTRATIKSKKKVNNNTKKGAVVKLLELMFFYVKTNMSISINHKQ